jgi:hypothetical protein
MDYTAIAPLVGYPRYFMVTTEYAKRVGAQSVLIPLGPRLIRKSSRNDVWSWQHAQDPSSLAAACAWSVVLDFFVEAVWFCAR